MNTEQLLNLHDETCSKCKEIMKRKNKRNPKNKFKK